MAPLAACLLRGCARVCSFCFCFFSSRRRHTRYWRDWSSDVCSSDLESSSSAFFFPAEQNWLHLPPDHTYSENPALQKNHPFHCLGGTLHCQPQYCFRMSCLKWLWLRQRSHRHRQQKNESFPHLHTLQANQA